MMKFFEQFPEIVSIMSEKEDGSMKLVEEEVIAWENEGNRRSFFEKNGINSEGVIIAGLVHGSNVQIISDASQKIIAETDGLVTNSKDVFLAITIADCVPVFFWEKEKKIIALAHGGWRGIVGNIIENTIEKIEELGGSVENVHIALGPGINDCHFEIKEDVMEKFSKYPEFIKEKDDKTFVDLKGIIMKQLLSLGIDGGNIENDSTCTHCCENLFSYRRDKNIPVEAMIAVVGFNGETSC